MNRIARLRELLEEPLLITNLVNVRYLTGFDSSNAALFVEPERARLFTDFRYIAAARAVAPDGVDVVETKRSLMKFVGEALSGRVGFEASVLPFSFADDLRGAGLDLVPRSGLVEQLRAVKDDGELARSGRAARSPTGCSSGSLPRCASSAAASATSPGTSSGSSTRRAPRRCHSSRSSAPARPARTRTREQATR